MGGASSEIQAEWVTRKLNPEERKSSGGEKR
jgi:hypothetical protein